MIALVERGGMNPVKAAVRQAAVFGQKEFLLSLCVFTYLLVSFSAFSAGVPEKFAVFLHLFFAVFENYVTVAVYLGVRQALSGGQCDIPGVFVQAKRFFSRVLAYKIFAGFFALLLAVFCLGMIDVVKGASGVIPGFITVLTAAWVSLPAYLLVLTFFTPLIIIAEDLPLSAAVKKSVSFSRACLPGIALLVLLAAPLWGFAIFLMKVYNNRGLFSLAGVFYFISVLEIATVKLFLAFYKEKREI